MHILVPTAFSETAYRSLEQAVRLAVRFEAKITVLHARLVHDWLVFLVPDASVAHRIAALAHDIDRAFEGIMVRRRTAEPEGCVCHSKLLEHPYMSGRLIAAYLFAACIDRLIIQEAV